MTPIRREVLRVLEELSERYPEMRIGQLVANFSSLAKGPTPEAIYDVEDEEFVTAVRKHLEKRARS
jgi:hypothetical protein